MRYTSFCIGLFLLLLLPGCAAGQQCAIQELCPDTYLPEDADEYIIISGSPGISIYTLSDGEGTISFGPVSDGNSITIAREASSFYSVNKEYPDYEIIDTVPGIPDVLVTESFRLANTGDEVTLLADGMVADRVIWPRDFHCREGQVHFRDREGNWDPRVLMIGQSRLSSFQAGNVSGTAFLSPDCAREVLLQVIRSAEEEVLVNVYEFTDTEIADALCLAQARGVNVTVLIEGGPVGGIPDEEKNVIFRLRSCHIPVWQMGTVSDSHAPYRFDHAKYIVSDAEHVLVTSENFTIHSLPPAGTVGNRGWGILLHDDAIAGYYRELFFQDVSGPGISSAVGEEITSLTPYVNETYKTRFHPLSFTNATISVVVSPDTSSMITDMIKTANESIFIEQAYIKKMPDGSFHPYLSAAIDAARRGVTVRILLDSYWYNVEGESDNDEMVSLLNTLGRGEDLPLEAKCIDLSSTQLLKVHTKGVVIDKKKALVSSINWNENSPTFNREAGIIIDHPDAGAYFAFAFLSDWEASGIHPALKREGQDPIKLSALICIIVVLLAIVVYRHRRYR